MLPSIWFSPEVNDCPSQMTVCSEGSQGKVPSSCVVWRGQYFGFTVLWAVVWRSTDFSRLWATLLETEWRYHSSSFFVFLIEVGYKGIPIANFCILESLQNFKLYTCSIYIHMYICLCMYTYIHVVYRCTYIYEFILQILCLSRNTCHFVQRCLGRCVLLSVSQNIL